MSLAMERQERFRQPNIFKILLLTTVQIFFCALCSVINSIVDTIFIAHIPTIGSDAIISMAIAIPRITILVSGGYMVGSGVAIKVGKSLINNKTDEIESDLIRSTVLAFVFGVVVLIFGGSLIEYLFKKSTFSANIVECANEYVKVILYGTPIYFLVINFSVFLIGIKYSGVCIVGSMVGCISNIIFNMIFLQKYKMGIEGIAIATMLSQMISLIYYIYYFRRKKTVYKITFKQFKVDVKSLLEIIRMGMPSLLIRVGSAITQIIFNNSLRIYGGESMVGALPVIISILSCIILPLESMSYSLQNIISYYYLERSHVTIRKTFIEAVYIITGILVILNFIVLVNPYLFINIFTKDIELRRAAVAGLRIYFSMIPTMGFTVMAGVYLRSVGRVSMASIIYLLRVMFLIIPLLLGLGHFYGIEGVWAAQPICDLIMCMVCIVIIYIDFKSREYGQVEKQVVQVIKGKLRSLD